MQKIAHADDYRKSFAREPRAAEQAPVLETFADYIAREEMRIRERRKVS